MSAGLAPRVRQTRGTAEPLTHNRIERDEASQPRRDTTTEAEDQDTTDKGEREKEGISNSTKKTAKPHRHGQGKTPKEGVRKPQRDTQHPHIFFIYKQRLNTTL